MTMTPSGANPVSSTPASSYAASTSQIPMEPCVSPLRELARCTRPLGHDDVNLEPATGQIHTAQAVPKATP